jgi:predicted permease
MAWLYLFLDDLGRAFRKLIRIPRFSVPAISAIALGIGFAAAVFSFADQILFRDPPYPNGSRVVSVGVLAPIIEGAFQFAGPALLWKQQQKPFASMAAWQQPFDCDLSDNTPKRIACASVDADFLPTLGVRPLLGRNFATEEDLPNASPVALISYELWSSRFGRNAKALGRTFSLNGERSRIIGVLPRDFEFPTTAKVDVLAPLALDPALAHGGSPGATVRLLAHLREGVSLQQAQLELQPLFRDFVQSAPPPFRKVLRLQVRSLKDFQAGDARTAATLLFAAALGLLLIVCANVGNLMLGRSVERRREFAVRSALGASDGRMLSEKLTEALATSVVGSAVGCALAEGLLRIASAVAPLGIQRLHDARIDGRVLLFAVAAAMFTTVMSVAATAFERPRPEWLTSSQMQTARRSLLRNGLLSLQVAVALALLTNAVLLARSLYLLQLAPLGFSTDHRIAAELTVGSARYADVSQRVGFYEELERRIGQIPGVTSFAISDSMPPAVPARSMPLVALETEGGAVWDAERGTGPEIGWRAVTPGYFPTLGIALLRGRDFREEDRAPQANTIILNRAMAELLFPNMDPVGRHVNPRGNNGQAAGWSRVVGVVDDAANAGLGAKPGPEFYMPRRHSTEDLYLRGGSSRHLSIAVLSPIAPDVLANEVREKVASLDPTIPVDTATMRDRVSQTASQPRFNSILLGMFAAAGTLLTVIGVYSVIALVVAQRTREIGIRMALGAKPAQILRMVLWQGMTWVFGGALVGVLGSLYVGRYVKSILYGVGPNDPVVIAFSAALISVIAMAAVLVPSNRAARVDPMVSLRQD